jgi:ubiquinone/menaquinone biosynthesis C-methylase UbiE
MEKNWFDKSAEEYKSARPQYPKELFSFLSEQTAGHGLAIDCGAGNGQATVPLALYFDKVVGLDVGANLLANATKAEKVSYLLSSASHLPFEANSVDLITSASAAHWFELEKFYDEVGRVLKPGGVLALWTYYYMPKVDPKIDSIVEKLLEVTLAKYMNPRLEWVNSQYENLPFPYAKEKKAFEYSITGDFNRFAAVLESLSFVKTYTEKTGKNPLDEVRDELEKLWGPKEKERKMTWDNHMVIGRKPIP